MKSLQSLPPGIKIALLYVVLGIIWILLSDSFFLLFFEDIEFMKMYYVQMFKGIFYVLVTGLLFYLLIKRYYRTLNEKVQLLEKANRELKEEQEKLKVSNRELEQFAYVTSHDLQEPLRMVTNFLSRLQQKYGQSLNEKGNQYVDFALKGAQKMRNIILDLLDYSRMSQINEPLEKIDLNDMLDDIQFLFRRRIEHLNAQIEVQNLPSIHFQKAPIRQVFLNLVENALFYHRENTPPEVKVRYQEEKDRWKFAVSDNGVGIPEDQKEEIFLIFKRINQQGLNAEGSGIGLATAKRVIENSGGKIWVESEEGKGSTFYFTIPKTNEANQ